MARQGLEEYIAHYTDALPYSIVPNGNGVGPGNPTGNNAAGSPLGPVNQNGNGAPGSFRVGSWTNYLSTAYGAGVSPAYPGSVTELFPFNFLSQTSGNQARNTGVNNAYGLRGAQGGLGGQGGQGGLGGQGGQGGQGATGCGGAGRGLAGRVTTGVVVAVRGDGFDVKAQDGQVYTINVAPCTQLNANKADYILETGHQAVVKGEPKSAGNNFVWDASLVTCLQ